jgi:AraC family transcriptional regulator, regulatory protein of adaptative response / methylated-DNA-[protein]-cysteine methyltransferase
VVLIINLPLFYQKNIKYMNKQAVVNYHRIAEAIAYIQRHFKEQPTLETIAAEVHMSPFHFQRLFTDWAGVSPKKFLQYTSVQYAKKILNSGQATLFNTALETGLSGTSRLHDLFIKMEGMTPGEYKNGGAHLVIHYSYGESRFGNILVASTTKGICYMAFADDRQGAFNAMVGLFPNANFLNRQDEVQQHALHIFRHDWKQLHPIKLHLKGTNFQLKVWEMLLKIPLGHLCTYGHIAHQINNPSASRAVGTAIGSNPVAFLIPCHRVILASGNIGGYMWGETRKTAMIGWEAARVGGELVLDEVK